MDQDEQSSGSIIRYKSPTFRETETQLLVKLIDKYRNPILYKSMLNSVTYIKDKAWAELTKEFNRLNTGNGYQYDRTTDVLKTKWDNLKRMARKSSKNVLEPGDESFHSEIIKDVIKICKAEVGLIAEAESDGDPGDGHHTKNPLHDRIVRLIQTKLNDPDPHDIDALPATQDDDSEDASLPSCSKESKDEKFNASPFDSKEDIKSWDCNIAEDSVGENEKAKPSTVFSARDCRLLLHCVRQEKNVLFTNSPLVRKQKAWDRITRTFNRQSPTKRSPPELKKKFQNLKAMVSRVNNAKCFTINKRKKYKELSDDDDGINKKIKSEPRSDVTDDFEFDNDDDDGDGLDPDLSSKNGSVNSDNHDPLSNGAGGDSGLGLMNHSNNKEVDKLKIELLNYELETAKLQRKRIEDAIRGEMSDRDSRALETSLRIRAARLEVLAAEAKIPPLHPALVYTPEETRAQKYLSFRIT